MTAFVYGNVDTVAIDAVVVGAIVAIAALGIAPTAISDGCIDTLFVYASGCGARVSYAIGSILATVWYVRIEAGLRETAKEGIAR